MNRNTRRRLSQNGEIEKIIKNTVDELMDEVRKTTRNDAYRNAFAALLLACVQIAEFDAVMVRRVAVKTLKNIEATECATELVNQLKDATGFDVDEPLMEHANGMEVE